MKIKRSGLTAGILSAVMAVSLLFTPSVSYAAATIQETEIYYVYDYDADGNPVNESVMSEDEGSISPENGDFELEAPTDLQWLSSGKITFKTNNLDHVVYYKTRIYCNDRLVTSFNCGSFVGALMLAKCDENGNMVWDIKSCIRDSGTYTFDVVVGKSDAQEDMNNGVTSEKSPERNYVSPAEQLSVPKNIRWSKNVSGRAEWDAVPNSDGYMIMLLEDGKQKWSRTTSSLSEPVKTYEDFLPQIGNVKDHKYTFTVAALSSDVDIYRHSEQSAASAVLSDTNTNKESGNEEINKAKEDIKNADSPESAQAVLEDFIQSASIDEHQLKLQSDSEYRSVLGQVEDEYKNKANVSVDINVTDDAEVDAGKVSITGGALNANAGESVKFAVSRPAENDNRALDPNVYSNVVRFDMELNGASGVTEDGNLRYPVEVTIPIPTYFKEAPFIYVIHYHHSDDGYDILYPRLNDDNTISFTVTHFSEIAIAESSKQEIVVKQKCDISSCFSQKCDKYEVSKETKKYASVTKAGVVTGLKQGTAVIAGYKKGDKNKWDKIGETEITISLPTFKTKTAELTYPEATFDAAANIEGSSLKVTEWKSSKGAVATVDKATGLVTAKGKGAAKISAIYGEGKLKKEYSFNVKVNIPVQSKVSGKLLTGGTLKLKLTNTKKPITWTSTVSGNAIVDNKGQASLINAGDAEIVATVDGIDYKWNFKIEEPKIKGSDTINLDLKKKKKAKIALTNTKYKVTDVKWTISEDSDQGVISIDDKGNVTALKAGKVDVYTETGGVKNTYHITVAE